MTTIFLTAAGGEGLELAAGGESKEVEIARSGHFVDMHGARVEFDASILKRIAAGFDLAAEHKIKIGHVPIRTDTPDYGDVVGLRYDSRSDRLLATIVPTEAAVEKSRKEGFRGCSPEFIRSGRDFVFQHLALLGARKPAIKGLAPVLLASANKGYEAIETGGIDFAGADQESVELHLAIEKERAAADVRGEVLSYLEGARLIERGRLLDDRVTDHGHVKVLAPADVLAARVDFAGADPESVELHLAIEKERAAAKANGQALTYLEAARRVERRQLAAAAKDRSGGAR